MDVPFAEILLAWRQDNGCYHSMQLQHFPLNRDVSTTCSSKRQMFYKNFVDISWNWNESKKTPAIDRLLQSVTGLIQELDVKGYSTGNVPFVSDNSFVSAVNFQAGYSRYRKKRYALPATNSNSKSQHTSRFSCLLLSTLTA